MMLFCNETTISRIEFQNSLFNNPIESNSRFPSELMLNVSMVYINANIA